MESPVDAMELGQPMVGFGTGDPFVPRPDAEAELRGAKKTARLLASHKETINSDFALIIAQTPSPSSFARIMSFEF